MSPFKFPEIVERKGNKLICTFVYLLICTIYAKAPIRRNAYVISVCLLFLSLFFIRLPLLRATAKNILTARFARMQFFLSRLAIFSGIKQKRASIARRKLAGK